MPGDMSSRPDRRRVAVGAESEVEYLARKYGLVVEQVEDLIHQYGHRRARLDAAALRLAD